MTTTPLALHWKLEGRSILMVGGGSVAERRIARCLAAGAAVTVVSPTLTPSLTSAAKSGSISWIDRIFASDDARGFTAIFSATGDTKLARTIASVARSEGVLFNSAEDESLSDFHVPAAILHEGVQITISTAGSSPALSKRLRQGIEEWLASDPNIQWSGDDLEALLRERAERKASSDTVEHRLEDHREAARQLWRRDRSIEILPRGTVALVGAGPGDPGLLTRRALEFLLQADVVYYDRLVSDEVLAEIPPTAEKIYVGKEVGCAHRANIADLMIEAAQSRRRVVRLKGGDPTLFGRVGEEMLALHRADVEFVLVPGVSALSAVPGAAGIPITYRGVASEVVVRSGHVVSGCTHQKKTPRAEGTTHVYFMAVGRLSSVLDELLNEGVAADTPVAIISKGTCPGQKVIEGTLTDILPLAERERIKPPALVVVGDVVKFRHPAEFQALLEKLSGVPPAPRKTSNLKSEESIGHG